MTSIELYLKAEKWLPLDVSSERGSRSSLVAQWMLKVNTVKACNQNGFNNRIK
ncbi:MAG: hypothetical protein JGK33_21865 [Microcoleus sp. PH2017_11_PCY_U_A]|uniref:hypothetical protein n=1 Tax=Microcoleus sp. PH2017_22_RUC_O_B TaxID=2798833 RepID=UPI001D826093|nr:hypothetical protein [Microcoleus sp. PH2017_22_RUC_O_B]MCC3462262.1 hypothetical protein [Microcoleus sp. PH2017_11_PCY_U_A]